MAPMPDETMPTLQQPDVQRLKRPDGSTIAYRLRSVHGAGEKSASRTGVLFLGGFKSDMTGSKATALDAWAARCGRSFVRFDYFGHGDSSGAFTSGTISRWREDALAILDHVALGPQILVGSSMGGWIALLVALARPERVRALALIAPAPDFTEDLMWAQFPDEVKRSLKAGQVYAQPSFYDDNPYEITYDLIEDGRRHLLLRAPIAISKPVRILHGMCDVDVPWQRSLTLIERLESTDVVASFIKTADHRLSDDRNLARLVAMVEGVCREVEAADA